MYIIRSYCLDLQKIEYPDLRKFNRKLFPLYVRNVWICRKIENPELRKFNRNFGTLQVQIVWICIKLNIQNYINSTGNCLHYSTWNIVYICTDCLGLLKNWISRIAYIRWEIVCIICNTPILFLWLSPYLIIFNMVLMYYMCVNSKMGVDNFVVL